MIRPFASFLAFGLMSLMACNNNVVFDKSFELNPYQGWEYTEELDFSFTVEDTSSSYQLFLDLEHGFEFPFQNLYLRLTTFFPNGDTTKAPLSLELADKSGRWYGKCGSKTCDVSIPLQEEIHFDRPGDYSIRIEQFMRENPVLELHQLGLRLLRE